MALSPAAPPRDEDPRALAIRGARARRPPARRRGRRLFSATMRWKRAQRSSANCCPCQKESGAKGRGARGDEGGIDDEGEAGEASQARTRRPRRTPARASRAWLLLQPGGSWRGVLLVRVERALQHLQRLLVVALAVADLRQVVEDLALGDGRAVVQLLEEERAERLLRAIDAPSWRRRRSAGRTAPARGRRDRASTAIDPGSILKAMSSSSSDLSFSPSARYAFAEPVVDGRRAPSSGGRRRTRRSSGGLGRLLPRPDALYASQSARSSSRSLGVELAGLLQEVRRRSRIRPLAGGSRRPCGRGAPSRRSSVATSASPLIRAASSAQAFCFS